MFHAKVKFDFPQISLAAVSGIHEWNYYKIHNQARNTYSLAYRVQTGNTRESVIQSLHLGAIYRPNQHTPNFKCTPIQCHLSTYIWNPRTVGFEGPHSGDSEEYGSNIAWFEDRPTFGEEHRLHRQAQRMSQAGSQQKQAAVRFLYDHEYRGDIFFRNVGPSPIYTVLQPRKTVLLNPIMFVVQCVMN
jgi:hypothetical protein